jgi:hypothetical protein
MNCTTRHLWLHKYGLESVNKGPMTEEFQVPVSPESPGDSGSESHAHRHHHHGLFGQRSRRKRRDLLLQLSVSIFLIAGVVLLWWLFVSRQ